MRIRTTEFLYKNVCSLEFIVVVVVVIILIRGLDSLKYKIIYRT
jgi:hypothetical protein